MHYVARDDDLVVIDARHATVVRPLSGIDPSLGMVELRYASPTISVLRGGRPVAVQTLRVLAAAEAAGGARACLEMATDYAKVREQFGRIIGSFQAVKHKLADMLCRKEMAVAAAWAAASAPMTGDPAAMSAATAAVTSLEAYLANARACIQVLGGIGFTWEHDAHLYLRRASALLELAGPPNAAMADIYELASRGVAAPPAFTLPADADRFRAEARAAREAFETAAPDDRQRVLADSGFLVPSSGAGNHGRLTAQEVLELARSGGDDDPVIRRDLGRLLAEADALRQLNLRMVTEELLGSKHRTDGTVVKLIQSEHCQRISELAMTVGGTRAIIGDQPRVTRTYLFDRSATIAGGTSEISRNVISERLLGLPRER